MLQPEIPDHIDHWTKILATWFVATDSTRHLNHHCPVDDVLYDLMACLSGLIRDLECKDQPTGLDLVGAILRDCRLPHVEKVFRSMVPEFPPPHSAAPPVAGNLADPWPEEYGDDYARWMELFPCQRRSRDLKSRSTFRLLEDLIALMGHWYRCAEIVMHRNCDLESCSFIRVYSGMTLWTTSTIECLRSESDRLRVTRWIDGVFAEWSKHTVLFWPAGFRSGRSTETGRG